jgi:hypothetical protein
MHHSEMNTADFGGIIVQQRDNAIVEGGFDSNLFVHFALNPSPISFLVPGKQRFVGVVHVSADSD